MSLENLEKNIINAAGQKGKLWLAALPKTIADLSAHWQLSNIQPVLNMNWNYIAFAMQYSKQAVVLKICFDPQVWHDECQALMVFAGNGCIKLLDAHKTKQALLLEKAIPGISLKSMYSEHFTNTFQHYAHVVKALAAQSSSMQKFTHVINWCKAIDQIQDSRFEKTWIEKAKALKTYLLNTVTKEYVCHGDLHLENIIQQGDHWIAIDPKGIIGEMAFEAAAFDLVDMNELNHIPQNSDKILQRVQLLASALNIDSDRLLAWIFLRILISAQWFIEDHGDPMSMLKLAKLIYDLLGQTNMDNKLLIQFEPAKLTHKEAIFTWLNEPFVQEFWDNTQAHKEDIVNFIDGRQTPSHYVNGEYTYWVGKIDQVPYCLIMTMPEKMGVTRPAIKNEHLSKNGNTYSIDFMIGNRDFFGKGLGAKTLSAFIEFFKIEIDSKADTFFIDPDIQNSHAKHVYEKAGFHHVGDFIMEGDGCFAGHTTHFLVKKYD